MIMICETPEQPSTPSEAYADKQICQELIDFGRVFLDRPASIQIQALVGSLFESDLRDIVYFENQ